MFSILKISQGLWSEKELKAWPGIPWGSSGKESALQCRGCAFLP